MPERRSQKSRNDIPARSSSIYALYTAYYASVTAAVECDHLVVLFQDDVLVVVEVEQTDRVELVRDAAGRVDRRRVSAQAGPTHAVAAAAVDAQRVQDALDGGVVGRMLILSERERADAAALVGVVALRRDDPAGPAYPLEVHVHLVPLTGPTTTPARGRPPVALYIHTYIHTYIHIFAAHIDSIVLKAAQRSYLIFKSFQSHDRDLLVKSYKTYVRPLLETNSQIWSPHLLKVLKLFSVGLLKS